MKNKSSVYTWLKPLFISAIALSSLTGFAQEKQQKQDSTATVISTKKLQFDPEIYNQEIRLYQEAQQISHLDAKKPDKKAGILVIKGSEDPDSIRYINLASSKIGSMIYAFSNNQVDAVGTPKQGIVMDTVLNHLRQMAKKVKNDIILFDDFHGIANKFFGGHEYNNTQQGVFSHNNDLQMHNGDLGIATSDYFYGEIGDEFEANSDLKSKKLYVAHISCNGMSASESFTVLPGGSVVIAYSSKDRSTFNVGHRSSVEFPFTQNANLVATGENFIMSSMLNANMGLNPEDYNNPKIITIDNGPSDTVHVVYNGRERLLFNQGHHATIIDPIDDIWRLKEMGISQRKLEKSFERHTKDLLSDAERKEILLAYSLIKTPLHLEKQSAYIRDGIFAVCASYLMDNKKLQQSLLVNNIATGVKGYDPNGDYYNFYDKDGKRLPEANKVIRLAP